MSILNIVVRRLMHFGIKEVCLVCCFVCLLSYDSNHHNGVDVLLSQLAIWLTFGVDCAI